MSKESRRAARLARESRRAGGTMPSSGAPARDTQSDAASDGVAPAGSATMPGARPPAGVRTSASTRAGRRERVRPHQSAPFLERYRSTLVTIAAVVIVAGAVGFVFLGSTQPAYACTNQFNPSPTPPVEPGSSIRLGFAEEGMGRTHEVDPGQKYLWCPPASGNHFNGSGIGPITPRLYRPEEKVGPSNWVHNLEHGSMVVLYRGDSTGATQDGQQAFRDYIDAFPTSEICKVPPRQLSPLIARFDDMPHPFAALVWGRVFYLDTWDPGLVNRFYLTEAERLDKDGALIAPVEDVTGCKSRIAPSGAPSAEPSAAPSVAPSASSLPSAAPSAAPSASPAPS